MRSDNGMRSSGEEAGKRLKCGIENCDSTLESLICSKEKLFSQRRGKKKKKTLLLIRICIVLWLHIYVDFFFISLIRLIILSKIVVIRCPWTP